MGEVFPLNKVMQRRSPAAHNEKHDLASNAFQAFADAARLAQTTLRLEDGMKAGKAWAGFLKMFEGGAQ